MLGRSEPGKLNAAAASGISDFLLFGFFKNLGLEVAHVPYRDIMQAPGDLAEGRIQVLSSSLAVPQPLAHAGRLKILAVTSKQRAPGELGGQLQNGSFRNQIAGGIVGRAHVHQLHGGCALGQDRGQIVFEAARLVQRHPHDTGALAVLSAALSWDPAPWCPTIF